MPLADRCEHGGPTDMNALINQSSSPEAKIALFRSLFRGREDVYPRRFESKKTGKSGYAPACANEWVRGICEKPRVMRRMPPPSIPLRDRRRHSLAPVRLRQYWATLRRGRLSPAPG